MTPYQETLLYWISERERIRAKKDIGDPKPWSTDPVFQTTYFCNVHREDDKVTKWIRNFYTHYVDDPMFEYNIIFSRFINYPETLRKVGFINEHTPDTLEVFLDDLACEGKVWGNAYVITTHGLPLPKARYLCQNVLGGVARSLEGLRYMVRQPTAGGHPPTLERAYSALIELEGLGSFLAAQVVADLKNTVGHPLFNAPDKATFVAMGPGSIRGLSWFFHEEPDVLKSEAAFHHYFPKLREFIDDHCEIKMDNQDLQNCLCEYDKYCRVKTGHGRSKRKYNGNK